MSDDSSRTGMFLIALTVTWVCFSALIFQYAGYSGITGSAVGLPNPGLTMDEMQHVMIKPRGAHAGKIIRTMDGVEVDQYMGDSFTAYVDREVVAKIKTLGYVYFLQ